MEQDQILEERKKAFKGILMLTDAIVETAGPITHERERYALMLRKEGRQRQLLSKRMKILESAGADKDPSLTAEIEKSCKEHNLCLTDAKVPLVQFSN